MLVSQMGLEFKTSYIENSCTATGKFVVDLGTEKHVCFLIPLQGKFHYTLIKGYIG